MTPQQQRRDQILRIVNELSSLSLVGNPFGRHSTTSPERVAEIWARLSDPTPVADLAAAVASWLRDEEHGHQWPQISQLLRLCTAARESAPTTEPGTESGPAGCELCGYTGTRTLCQHVGLTDKPVRIRTRLAACDTCERGRLLSAMSELPTWRQVWARIERPRPAEGVEWVESFCTGTPHRFQPSDTRPGSPFLSRLSPEEQHGPGERAQEIRAAVERAVDDPAWAARHISERLAQMGQKRRSHGRTIRQGGAM